MITPFLFFKICTVRILVYLILCTFLGALLISLADITSENAVRNLITEKSIPRRLLMGHKLGVIVPFRDRFNELLEFAPHMQNFLHKQKINHHIFIINQIDEYRFNRASLINAGFLFATSDKKACDYIVMHDIDLLPLNPQLQYSYPVSGPSHLAAPHLHPKYHYEKYVGGILIISKDDFIKVNGMSNKYWGWGLEDDEFFFRMKEANLKIQRPGNLSTGTHDTFKHIHHRNHKRDFAKCYNQYEKTRRRDRQTGINTLQYSIISENSLLINNSVSVSVINVKLVCDKTLTPWCSCPEKEPSQSRNVKKTGAKTSADKIEKKTNSNSRG